MVGQSAWEFLPEILLNLAKSLESLFPPKDQTGSIDACRQGLRQLGFETQVIERDFVPVLALRNALDVGHPSLAIFNEGDLEVVHRYCESVIGPFKSMLANAVDAVLDRRLVLEPSERAPRRDVVRMISRIRSRLPADNS